jgi:putative ABC transport system permease protein
MAAGPLFRLLLLAYPPTLRRTYGDEMALTVKDRWRDRPGVVARARLVAALLADLLGSWVRLLRGSRPPHGGRGRARVQYPAADVRSAARLFTRAPLFATGAVLTLAVGIGAATAVFSLADATLLRPLPIPALDRVVEVDFSWSYPDFRDLAAQQHVFSALTAWTNTHVGLERDGETQDVEAAGVSGAFFALASQRPVVGRLLTEDDDRPSAGPVVVLSERVWRRLFAADPHLVGSTLSINRRPVTVVGIVRAAFRGLSLRNAPEIFVPLAALPSVGTGFLGRPGLVEKRNVVWLQLAGRLKDGVTVDHAQAEVDHTYRRLHPPADPSQPAESAHLTPLVARALGLDTSEDLRRLILVLLGATGVTLLLACATVANLMLVRAEQRHRELAVRTALGAGRWHLGRLLLIESVAIGLGGSLAGLAVAQMALGLLESFALPGRIPIDQLGLSLNRPLLAASVGLGLGTALVCGMAPIWQTARLDVTAALRDGSRATARQSLRAVLVTAQVALCVLLLGGSLNFGRAVRFALTLDLGFDTAHTAITTIDPTLVRYSKAQVIGLEQQILQTLRTQPWVTGAAWSAMLPLQGMMSWQIGVPGYQPPNGENISTQANVVSDGYFAAMGIPLIAGRAFAPTDTTSAPSVVVIDVSMAKKFWPNGDALGSRLDLNTGLTDPHAMATVIGIAGDARRSVDGPHATLLYLVASQWPDMLDFGGQHLIVRSTTLDARATARETAIALRHLDPIVPVTSSETMRDHLDRTLMAHRLGLTLFLLFAGLAVILTSFGIYAVVAYAVAHRTREIGIRVALGAAPSRVLGLVVRQGLVPIGVGLTVGLVTFVWSSAVIERFMFAVPATSVGSIGLLALVVGCVATSAMLLPTRRALAVDPATALRTD